MDEGEQKRERPATCKSLRLDIEAATQGRTWLLLPEGFRHQAAGSTYPLPSRRIDLQKIVAIPIPLNKNDSGVIYIRRATEKFRETMARSQSAILDIGRRSETARVDALHFREQLKKIQEEAHASLDQVRAKAEEAIASLGDLFDLGRKGIDGQMRAHLDNKQWQGETITAADFRQCFRMVSQAVKGLGMPSTERASAREAIVQQAAEAMKATQEAVALAPGNDDGEVH